MRMKTRLWCLGAVILASMAWAGCQALEGFNYPTKTDVNDLHDADVAQRAELADALAKLMTDQHGEMTPAVAEALLLMNEQYLSVSAELREVAALVQAEGIDGTELAALIAVAFPGVGLWLREKMKPSRSAEAVENLQAEASDAKEKMHALELILAKAAKPGETIPSDTT